MSIWFENVFGVFLPFPRAGCKYHGTVMVETLYYGGVAVLLPGPVRIGCRSSCGKAIALPQNRPAHMNLTQLLGCNVSWKQIWGSYLFHCFILQRQEVHQRILYPLHHHRFQTCRAYKQTLYFTDPPGTREIKRDINIYPAATSKLYIYIHLIHLYLTNISTVYISILYKYTYLYPSTISTVYLSNIQYPYPSDIPITI